MKTKNIVTNTDSYKFLNNSALNGVSNIQSYFESRSGAKYPTTVFFGLQYFLKEYLQGRVVTKDHIEQAKIVAKFHLGGEDQFNEIMWSTIVDEYDGKLPVRIKAVPEGTEVEESNALMTITLTKDDERLAGLVNHLETLLTNVWGTSTVATKSKYIKNLITRYLDKTAMTRGSLPFQLHDFAQRSSKCPEQAATSGVAHLINFMGTDTVLAWECARDYYNASVEGIAYSVYASEHNYMMYKGRDGEKYVLGEILENRPTGIVSVVSDTYDIYKFVDEYVGKEYREQILSRDGTFVVRPDSVTPEHDTPAKMTIWILESLWKNFGGTINEKGYKVLDSHVRVIYGDSLTETSIEDILNLAAINKYSAENIVFGCGSYLLDKHNRDTQRFAYKSSAMKIDGKWVGVFKDPVGSNKTSKKGRLKLVKTDSGYKTLTEYDEGYTEAKDELVTVFENGELVKDWTLNEIRDTAS